MLSDFYTYVSIILSSSEKNELLLNLIIPITFEQNINSLKIVVLEFIDEKKLGAVQKAFVTYQFKIDK